MKRTLWPDSNDRLKKKFINGSLSNQHRIYYVVICAYFTIGSEPMSDAFIFEPIPYRSAVKDNCTHILVLRTRADDSTVTAKMGMLEKMIIKRYFGRKLKLPQVMSWMINQVSTSIMMVNGHVRYFNQTPCCYILIIETETVCVKRKPT